MELVHKISYEILRLHPPSHVIVRVANYPFKINDKEIKAGEGIIFHLEEASRNLPGYKNPLEFDPFREGVD